jgi:hypothetical protein
MRCEDALELLATGSAFWRSRARRHVARCPSCARESTRLGRITQLLAAAPALAPAERALWASAATASRPIRARRVRIAAVAAAVLFGIGLAAVALRPWPTRPAIEQPPAPFAIAGSTSRPPSPEVVRELDGLTANLKALSRELADLERRAELLDERRDAEDLSRRFDRFVAMNNP